MFSEGDKPACASLSLRPLCRTESRTFLGDSLISFGSLTFLGDSLLPWIWMSSISLHSATSLVLPAGSLLVSAIIPDLSLAREGALEDLRERMVVISLCRLRLSSWSLSISSLCLTISSLSLVISSLFLRASDEDVLLLVSVIFARLGEGL